MARGSTYELKFEGEESADWVGVSCLDSDAYCQSTNRKS